jgi:hypothetical protein
MTPAERKAAQRRRDKLSGWAEVTVRIAASRADDLRAYAASLPPPEPPTDPAQLSMIDMLDQQLAGDVSPGKKTDTASQGSLF